MNTLSLSYADNPDLKLQLGQAQPGDKITLEIEVMVKSNDGDQFDAVVESITESEPTEAADSEEEDMPEDEAPAMVLVVKKGAKKE